MVCHNPVQLYKGSNCIPPLRNTINDEHLDEMVYDDDKKCELLNKYFSLVSKLEEENIPVLVRQFFLGLF
jgi:hypothetical protein